MSKNTMVSDWRGERDEVRLAAELGTGFGEFLAGERAENSLVFRRAARELLFVLDNVPREELLAALDDWYSEFMDIVRGMSPPARAAHLEAIAAAFLMALGRPVHGVMRLYDGEQQVEASASPVSSAEPGSS